MQLARGHLQLVLQLANNQSVTVTSPSAINNGTWYDVHVARIGTWASLSLSAESIPSFQQQVSGSAVGSESLLAIDSDSVYVSDLVSGYDGCLTDLRLDGLEVPLTSRGNLHFTVLHSARIADTPGGSCEIEQCQNNGTLTFTSSNTLRAFCKCPAGFIGERCEQDIDECFSNPCPPAADRCEDLVNGFRCHYTAVPLRSNEGVSDSLSIVLIVLLLIVIAVSVAVVSLRYYSSRKIRKIRHQSIVDHVITNFSAAVSPQDVVYNKDTQGGNVMQYGEEGGGQLDVASEHIDFEQLFRADSSDDLDFDGDLGDSLQNENMCHERFPQALGNRLMFAESQSTNTLQQTSDYDSSSQAKSVIKYSATNMGKASGPSPPEMVDMEDAELVAVLASGYTYSQPDEVDLYLGRRLQHLNDDDAAADAIQEYEDEGQCIEAMSLSHWSQCAEDATYTQSSSSDPNDTTDYFEEDEDGRESVSTATTTLSALLPPEQRYRLTFMSL